MDVDVRILRRRGKTAQIRLEHRLTSTIFFHGVFVPPLILASTSRYRKELLAHLGIPFETRDPETDETALPGESPPSLALRLAVAKATQVAASMETGLVIGADQVAHCEGKLFGKPGSHAGAVLQLRWMRGRTTHFDTAVALVDAASGRTQGTLVGTRVTMRALSDEEIESYLCADTPYDCAGAAKCEGLGIVLMERVEGDDPTALIGLPLISLTTMLRNEGVPLFPRR